MEEPSEKKGSGHLVKLEEPGLRGDLTIRSAQPKTPGDRGSEQTYFTPPYYGDRKAREDKLARAWFDR